MQNEISRCSGRCCKCFAMRGFNSEEIQTITPAEFQDADMIKEMVIPLGQGYYDDDKGEFVHDEERTFCFTCKYHDVESGDCLNYENRPTMCRDFPYDKPCTFTGCTRKTECPVKQTSQADPVPPVSQQAI